MIKTFKQFVSSLFEKKGDTFEYGCAMVYFDFPDMHQIHEMIVPEDVYLEEGDRSFGLEDEPHTTLLFGLHSNDLADEEVLSKCKSKPVGQIKLHNASLFENEKYDVLKFDAHNPVLHEINAELVKLPHTTSFPDYHPHSTIAYIKKGQGRKYADLLEGKEFTVHPNKIVYSKPDGSRIEENLA